GTLNIGFLSIKIDPVFTTEGHVDPLAHTLDLGPGNLFLYAFGLTVHPISDIPSGGTAHHSADNGAKGGVPAAHIVADDPADHGATPGTDCGAFLGFVRILHGITAHQKAQGHKDRYTPYCKVFHSLSIFLRIDIQRSRAARPPIHLISGSWPVGTGSQCSDGNHSPRTRPCACHR